MAIKFTLLHGLLRYARNDVCYYKPHRHKGDKGELFLSKSFVNYTKSSKSFNSKTERNHHGNKKEPLKKSKPDISRSKLFSGNFSDGKIKRAHQYARNYINPHFGPCKNQVAEKGTKNRNPLYINTDLAVFNILHRKNQRK